MAAKRVPFGHKSYIGEVAAAYGYDKSRLRAARGTAEYRERVRAARGSAAYARRIAGARKSAGYMPVDPSSAAYATRPSYGMVGAVDFRPTRLSIRPGFTN